MALFARSDLMSVSIPATSGGCGSTHSRPVTRGSVARVWKLDCPRCEAYLKGDHKAKVIKVVGGDKNKGIPSRMEHVADADPHWSSTPETVPATPDEEHVNSVKAEIGKEQLNMLQAFAAAKAAGLDIPENAMWVLERNFDPKVLKGEILCIDGHQNPAGTKFCGECGKSLHIRAEIPSGGHGNVPEGDYSKVPVKILRDMCKDQGLPVTGNRAQLIERLS